MRQETRGLMYAFDVYQMKSTLISLTKAEMIADLDEKAVQSGIVFSCQTFSCGTLVCNPGWHKKHMIRGVSVPLIFKTDLESRAK